jgi:hypothetical protein
MNFDDQQVAAIQGVGIRCQTEALFPCSAFHLSDTILKALSQRHFERLITPDISDDPVNSSEEPEYFDTLREPDFYEDLIEQSHESEEVLILGLDLLDSQPDNFQSGNDSTSHSITEDSLKVMKRRMIKKKKSQMKRLSDFRKSFVRQPWSDLEETGDLLESSNTTIPLCA